MMTPRLYKKKHPELVNTAAAVTLPSQRQVHFLMTEFEKRHVFHELVHCYVTYMCTDSANLTFAQGEEMLADFFGDYAEEFYRLGTRIIEEISPPHLKV